MAAHAETAERATGTSAEAPLASLTGDGGAPSQGAPSSPAARTQIAFIRALVDEIERYAPTDPHVASLGEQLEYEVERLLTLLRPRAPGATSPDAPLSDS